MTNPNVNQLDPVVQQQLDKINEAGNREKPEELWLEVNSKQYLNLYTDGISKNELARKIIDQRNINDKKDYFSETNKEQIKKANSYAEYILNDQVSILEKEQKEHTAEIAKEKEEAKKEKNEQVDELKNKLNGENTKPKESSEAQTETTKERLWKTIDRYIEKVKQLKNSNEDEKKKINTEMDELQKELKKAKEEYETAKNLFMGKINYDEANLPKISTRWIRFGKKTVKGWVVTRSFTERLLFSTIRRRMTANKIVSKFNKIGNDPVKWVRFIMWFEQDRFLRYTGIRLVSGMDQLWGQMWMLINPQQFHDQFNTGRKNILAVLEKGERTDEEQTVIDAIKKRLNYYWAAYARQRANAWTNPFIQAEKNATKEAKIIPINTEESKLQVA